MSPEWMCSRSASSSAPMPSCVELCRVLRCMGVRPPGLDLSDPRCATVLTPSPAGSCPRVRVPEVHSGSMHGKLPGASGTSGT
eukprot:5399497-Prymnesium_polylepis.1